MADKIPDYNRRNYIVAILSLIVTVIVGGYTICTSEIRNQKVETAQSNSNVVEKPSPSPANIQVNIDNKISPTPVATSSAPPEQPTPAKSDTPVHEDKQRVKASDKVLPTASTPAPQPTVIYGGVVNGKAISLPKPPYPPAARAAHASGAVTVEVMIDESGQVIQATAVSGDPLLREVAMEAARQARFSPTIVDGKPVKVSGVITYNFVP